MSIGFTVPFLNLISHPLANANQVGLLITAFGALFNSSSNIPRLAFKDQASALE